MHRNLPLFYLKRWLNIKLVNICANDETFIFVENRCWKISKHHHLTCAIDIFACTVRTFAIVCWKYAFRTHLSWLYQQILNKTNRVCKNWSKSYMVMRKKINNHNQKPNSIVLLYFEVCFCKMTSSTRIKKNLSLYFVNAFMSYPSTVLQINTWPVQFAIIIVSRKAIAIVSFIFNFFYV